MRPVFLLYFITFSTNLSKAMFPLFRDYHTFGNTVQQIVSTMTCATPDSYRHFLPDTNLIADISLNWKLRNYHIWIANEFARRILNRRDWIPNDLHEDDAHQIFDLLVVGLLHHSLNCLVDNYFKSTDLFDTISHLVDFGLIDYNRVVIDVAKLIDFRLIVTEKDWNRMIQQNNQPGKAKSV